DGPIAVSHGGSILKSQLTQGRDEDPDRVRYSDLSVMAVPPQKPRVLKKHDLITIIVREESQSSSSGTTDLKKNADIDAKVDSDVKKWTKAAARDTQKRGWIPRLLDFANPF